MIISISSPSPVVVCNRRMCFLCFVYWTVQIYALKRKRRSIIRCESFKFVVLWSLFLFQKVKKALRFSSVYFSRVFVRFVFVMFVFLSKKALSLQDASSYFSVMVFGRLVVLVKRQMDTYLVNVLNNFNHFLDFFSVWVLVTVISCNTFAKIKL